MKNLVLVRGLPGSGKSTLARLFYELGDSDGAQWESGIREICADNCWEEPYTRETFTAEKHGIAHKRCLLQVQGWMRSEISIVIVHNTFTTDSELNPYFDLAKEFGYRVHTLICENRHESESVHEVPEEVIEKMRERFSVKL